MSGLLIYTTGDTDVQLVENGQRWELKRDIAQEFSRQHGWSAVSSDIPKADPKEKKGIQKEGPFHVCTPKLDAILHYLRGQHIAIERAVLLYTNRPTQPNGRQDPYHVIPVLEHRLSQEHIEPYSVPYLSAGDLEGAPEGPAQDSALQRSVAQCIERAIAQHLSQTSDDVVVAVLGGHPVIREVVDELVPLHARGRQVLHLRLPDLSRTTPTTASSEAASSGYLEKPARYTPSSPSATISARRHALTLVERGSFVAAWGAVAHLEQEPSCQRWVQVIKTLFLWACSLPMDAGHGLPLPSLEQRAASAALRTEAALRCEDWPRAILGTYATFEAAVWDQLYQHHIDGTVYHEGKLLFHLRHALPASWVDPDDQKPKHAPIKLQQTAADGTSYYSIECYSDKASKILKEHLERATPNTCAALLALAQPIRQTSNARNIVAHGEPNREKLADAKLAFTRHHLWTPSRVASAPTLRFMSSPLVAAALTELGITKPESLFDNLIAAVRERLLAVEQP